MITIYNHHYFRSWRKLNVTIDLNSENLQTKEGCERLFKSCQKLGSVSGIFIVQDYKEKNETDNNEQGHLISSFDDVIVVTANLDMVSRNRCSGLRFVYSTFRLCILNHFTFVWV